MSEVTVNDLTSGTLTGTGVFDVIMRATKAHIQDEYARGRIKGAEYSQVYLGSIQAVMQNSLQLLLAKERTDLEAQLLEEQILSEQKKRLQIEGEIALLAAQTAKVAKDSLLVEAQTDKTVQDTANATTQGLILTEQIATEQRRHLQMDAEITLLGTQNAKTLSDKLLVDTQQDNAQTQGLILDEQVTTEQKKHSQLDAETLLTNAKAAHTDASKLLTDQQILNAVTEETVLKAQKCKLDAEFDLLLEQKVRTISEVTKLGSEISLLNQKVVTEAAQVTSMGVDTDSIIGRQKALYAAQTAGYGRDAEQKAAKMLVDSAMTQYTTSGTDFSGAGLDVNGVKAVVDKLKAGIGA